MTLKCCLIFVVLAMVMVDFRLIVDASLLKNKILLISFDGFAQHYFENEKFAPLLQNFHKFRRQGVFTESIQNVFTGETFPNHFSMATGLYPESHGIVSNIFYDPVLKAEFTSKKYGHPGRSDLDSPLWWAAEPIWVTARRLNLAKTATSMWPGDRVQYQPGNMKADFFRPDYDSKIPFEERIDQVLEWFQQGADFAMVFHFEPDNVGHFSGIEGAPIENELAKLDRSLAYLLDKVDKLKMTDNLDLIICSDHGMGKISGQIFLDSFLNLTASLDRLSRFGAHADLWPKEGQEDFVFETLDKAAKASGGAWFAYKKEDFPKHLNFRHNDRIAPIILLGNGTFISPNVYSEASAIDYHGVHGWDPSLPYQQPMFVARGPSFKSGGYNATETTLGMKTKDVYAVLARLLGADWTKLPTNNASLSVVADLFK